MTDKIGIVGVGYWGKIILKNLKTLGFRNITLCDTQDIDFAAIGHKYPVVKNYEDLNDCNKIFVLTTATTHYDICKYFLKRGVDVFCEKPLDTNVEKCEELYSIAKKHKAYLFVDWLFTFNPAVHKLKEIIDIARPQTIIANRLNYGPARYDVNARCDLAAHDISIAMYLMDTKPHTIYWHDFSRDLNSIQHDSTVGILTFDNTVFQINCSWAYPVKDRLYTIELEDRIIYWDDSQQAIKYYNGDYIGFDNSASPIELSLIAFFGRIIDQREITKNITEILSYENSLQ